MSGPSQVPGDEPGPDAPDGLNFAGGPVFDDIEAWARHYVLSDDLAYKLSPAPVPPVFQDDFAGERLIWPGRPKELWEAPRREKTPKAEAMREPRLRARVMHSFFHHELQAAELMCWAVLAFPDTPEEFRKGLIGICQDEIRHMNMYRAHIGRLGYKLGDFGIRDWFWKRVPSCVDATSFVSVMGMGLEAANLEHAPEFAKRFRDAGDERGAKVQEQVALEELSHVRFGTKWFVQWTGGCDFEEWIEHLPPPLSPRVLRGIPVDQAQRRAAGMTQEFVQALTDYVPDPYGRPWPGKNPAPGGSE